MDTKVIIDDILMTERYLDIQMGYHACRQLAEKITASKDPEWRAALDMNNPDKPWIELDVLLGLKEQPKIDYISLIRKETTTYFVVNHEKVPDYDITIYSDNVNNLWTTIKIRLY